MLEAFEGFLESFDTEQTRVLLLSSARPEGFSAGANLRELYEALTTGRSYQELASHLDRVHQVMNRLDELPCITIAAVQGVCFGGGFELALTADLIVADKSARFGFPELRLGLIPGFGGIPRLRRAVGQAVVADLLFTGRSLGAARAYDLGLVPHLVGRDQALSVARSMAEQMQNWDAVTVQTAKTFAKPIPLEELNEEKRLFMELAQRPKLLEALKAFVENSSNLPYTS